ncbi:hypothetical protein R69888_07020 [Paraburkholderia haematera]|uniref:Uncharacterized protein n=1 Tax=Paraburkholderia haematera TaxID=2793077 RepID=A0ABN7N5U8_9BURK|nr:hypothetical protein R69888_07020 [Paraburkholderia haematera]
MDHADGHQRVIEQAVVLQDADPCVDADQERGPERQHHAHHQQVALGGLRAGDVVRNRIADQQAEEGRDAGHLQRADIRRDVQIVLQQERVVAELHGEVHHAVLDRHEIRVRRNAQTQIGEADFQHQHERQREEQEEPQERHADHGRAARRHQHREAFFKRAGEPAAGRRAERRGGGGSGIAHCVSTTPLAGDQ